jgi:hypothetical protein
MRPATCRALAGLFADRQTASRLSRRTERSWYAGSSDAAGYLLRALAGLFADRQTASRLSRRTERSWYAGSSDRIF